MSAAFSLSTNDPQLKKRVEYLTKEMNDIDVNHDDFISREELYQYLDRKADREFDRDIANEIFDHMDKNHDGQITIEEFIKVYIEADEILKRKIEATKQNKDNARRQYEENLKKSEEAKMTEKPNAYGIMEGSFVHVTIAGARDLKSGITGIVDPYVEVALDGTQTLKTKVINDNPDPIWNEKFTFEVNSGGSQLKFTILDYGGITRGSFVGEVVVPLAELRDQTSQEAWLELYEKTGVKTQGQLNVKLQWIHSKVKYHALAAEKWKEHYAREHEELEELQNHLTRLWDPFHGMAQFKTTFENPRGSVRTESDFSGFDKRFLHTFKNIASKFMPENANENFFLKMATYACLITLLLALIMSFGRSVFFEIIYSLLVILHVQRNLFNDFVNWRYLAISVACSLVLIDFPFIFIYPGNWNKHTTEIDGNLFDGLRTFVDVITYLHVLLKIAEIIMFYVIYILQKKDSNPRVSIRKMNLAAS